MVNRVFVAVSLDGYIARMDGAVDWLDRYGGSPEIDYGYEAFIAAIDAIVMGRRTYESVLRLSPGKWPYDKPVFVLSTSRPPKRDYRKQLRIVSFPPRELIDVLSSEGYSELYIDGGKTIQRFLAEGLIDDIVITRVPLMLGSGIPLFAPGGEEVELVHVNTETYPNGVVQSRYNIRS
jgi:dihydrofolate reductase